ncbi:MAG: RDD family protein [Candidatus Rokubacteria bacterium]|nr:RDD family protein [Candidatus Rokubacteria bacterium]
MDGARPAGFWLRVAALAIDLVIVTFVERSFILVSRLMRGVWAADAWSATSLVGAFTFVFVVAYSTVLHAVAGQTIGKLLMRIRVVTVEGDLPGVGQAFLRSLGYGVSLVTFGLGFVMAGLRRDKRALHDLIAGTRVERVPAREEREAAPPPSEEPVQTVPDVG